MNRYPFLLSFVLTSLFLLTSVQAQNGTTILREDDSGIHFRFTPENIKKHNLQINNRSYVRFTFSDSDVKSKPGEPEIPVRTFIFAVPPGSDVTVKLVGSQYSEQTDIDLVPIAVWDKTTDIPQPKFLPEYELENKAEWFPKNILEVEKPAFMSNMRIVRIHVSPLQYLPEKRLVRIFNSIEVRLDFVGGDKSVKAVDFLSSSQTVQVLQRIVQNPDQAKKWVVKREKPSLRKGKKYFAASDYYKIPVEADGLYRITGKFLKDNGIEISSINPKTIKIFNNGGRTLPRNLLDVRRDSLIENAIEVVNGGDGKFGESDYILFYGLGVSGWDYSAGKFSHFINPYTFINIYWLTFNDDINGKRIKELPVPATVSKTVATYQMRQFVEDELYNLHQSGLVWFGSKFDDQVRETTFSLNFKNLVRSNRIKFRANLYSSTGGTHQFQFLFDGENIGSANYYGTRIYSSDIDTPKTVSGASHSLEIKYTPSSQISVSYLDWFEISAEAELHLNDNSLQFYSRTADENVEFQIGSVSGSEYEILNISDFANVASIGDYTVANGKLSYKAQLSADLPQRFAIIGTDKIKDITRISKDESSDLRNSTNGADFIIITHNDFFSAANSLKNLRESHDGLKTVVVKIDDVFDEFSAGVYDPTAIRDFLKFVYYNWAIQPQYVLLFGDGDYDYKNLKGDNDSNWIPPFETTHLSEIENRTTDDWFTYVNGDDSVMDFAIGRIPARTTEEAEFVVNKLIEYSTTTLSGFWKNLFTIIADDEIVEGGRGNETIHTYDAEDLVEKYVPQSFDLDKIYLTEYPIVYDASASWISKPAATEDLLSRINRGSLIFNFIGHGNPHLWTHERLLKDSRDANKIQNGSKYGFWITATCDFGRWDDPDNESFAEVILKMQKRGSVSMLTSARLVYASSNAAFNKQYVKFLFSSPGASLRIADAMRLAKEATYNKTNNEKFHILGDPTLKLAVPPLKIDITELTPDSLKALSLVKVKGKILDPNNAVNNYSGQIYLKTFDSRRDVTYVTKAGTPLKYKLPGNPIFRGSGSAENGLFEARFIVPKDISYGGKTGRISIYFENESIDGVGHRGDLIVDGTATDLVDNKGPAIEFEVNSQPLVDFSVLNNDGILEVILEDDKSGINITGDVGHKIIAIPDENSINQKEITHLFEYEQNSYLKGIIQLPLSLFPDFSLTDQSSKMHQLTLKAWDNANNSSYKIVQFELVPEGELVLKDVLNYPNPFLDNTTFTFFLNTEARVEIKIYTLAGRTIAKINDFWGSFGFNMIPWDGTDQDGDSIANGVYLFRVLAKNGDKSVEHIGKLIKMK